ncbi:glycine cleavage T C-terminal barrel domain-containing protein, partial [Shimia thalassica]|uniref:glycine cleavage T C-terminal barrel domain-containing protein n=1 Tax=Shimia thalassica TaxID=1715693 RepID=UPI0026E178F2
QIFAAPEGGDPIGEVTSGGFGPTFEGPVALCYVGASYALADTELFGEVRGKRMPGKVAKMPLVPANFKGYWTREIPE